MEKRDLSSDGTTWYTPDIWWRGVFFFPYAGRTQSGGGGNTSHHISPTRLTMAEMQGRYQMQLVKVASVSLLAGRSNLLTCKKCKCISNWSPSLYVWKPSNTRMRSSLIQIIRTLAESCIVKLATFSWEDSSSRFSLRICYEQKDKAPHGYKTAAQTNQLESGAVNCKNAKRWQENKQKNVFANGL